MRFVRAALGNPHATTVFVLALLVIGGVALTLIPTDLLPVFKTPAVQIVTLYPGMPPEVVERDMTSRLERWTGQSVGIEHQEAKSMLGVSVVKDFFREGIDPDTAMSQVTSLAVSDMFYLPPGTLPPMVMPFDPTASVPLCLLSVSSETMTEKELYDVAYFEMRNRLQSISGVIAPAVYGGVLRRILAYVDRHQLEARGLSPMDVVGAIQRANPFVPTGTARIGDVDYFVLSNAMVKKVEELNDTPVRMDDDGPVFLRDVGTPKDSHQIQTNIVRINGRRQVYIPIYRQPGANTLAIVDRVKERSEQILQRIRAFDPKAADLRMDVVMDQSAVVRDSIGSLRTNALIGGLLVALVIFLFLRSARSTLIVCLAVPLSVLGSLIGLYYTGNTINAMTLGGISLAIGILVDQAIVVTENITRHLRLGKSRRQAALDGAGEVALPVAVSTLTFIVVFYPVVFLSGMARFLFTPLALAVTFASITSYLVAVTFIPVAVSRVGGGKARAGGFFERLSSRYRSLASWTLDHRLVVLGAAALALCGAALGVTRLGAELFPPVDAGQFTVHVRAPIGTRLETTEKLVARIEDYVGGELGAPDPGNKDPSSDLRLLISNIGVLYDWPAAYTPNTGPMDAFVLVQLKESRSRSAQEWAARLRRGLSGEFPGVEFAIDTGGMLTAALNFGLPSPIDIQIQGSKLEISHEIAQAIANEAAGVSGAVDVRVAQPLDYPAIEITVDRTKAAILGLSQEDVIKNVAAALNSSVNFAPTFWIDPRNGNHYLIGAQYAEDDIRDFHTIEDIPTTGADSVGSVPLKAVAAITRTTTPALVSHQNITRTVDVYVNVEGRDTAGVAGDVEKLLATSPRLTKILDRYGKQGYRVRMSGEVKSMRESFTEFGGGLIIAAVLVYLVMVAQLRSFVRPLVILLTVPLGGIGVVAILWITGTHLSIPAFMGLILMVGIIVQYGILLVDFAARRQREGVPLREAILDAARDRLRPVLMTSTTTWLALMPMAIGLGRGSEANAPLARAIIGAVLAGTVLTLLVVPALYGLLAGRERPGNLVQDPGTNAR